MNFFYECELFQSKISEEDGGLKGSVLKKIEELRRRKSLSPSKKLKMYDRPSGIYILKMQGQGHNMRVLIQEYKEETPGGEDVTIYFLRDYISQADYEPRWRTRIEPELNKQGRYLELFPLPEEEKNAAVEAYLLSRRAPEKKRELLPEAMGEWLQDFSVDQDFAVYETKRWIQFAATEISGYESQFGHLLRDLYFDLPSIREVEDADRNILLVYNQDIYIVVEDTGLKSGTTKFPVYLLLGGGFLGQQDPETLNPVQIIHDTYLEKIRRKEYDFDTISRAAYRAYPAAVLKDINRWIELQRGSEKSNLALSPEQVKLLKHYRFPKFINGQAGSGKSEMLYYLFAEICFRKQALGFEGQPIFLTENEELLERALYDTADKIKNNAAYSGFSPDDNLQEYFAPFQKYILNHLIDDPENFPLDKRVNFAKFKILYENSKLPENTKRKLPAEVAWFIIYTFIKGYDAEIEELKPEDFVKLPRKDQDVIDETTYSQVYREVWQPFYRKLRNEDYWDRLDLVKWVLQNYEEIPEEHKFSVILCDEAQDFTRIELQLILKLSKYLEYDLSNLQQFPFTLAGDPFQTVNPTGFSLQKLKRLFTSELENNMQVKFQHEFTEELHYNYRSSAPIVNLANLIQYVRYRFLETSDLRYPQEARQVGDFDLPEFFSLKKLDNGFLEKLQFAVFLIPCNDGEEEEYIQSQELLKGREISAKSAARAKGSEYPVVVLYGFGEELIRDFHPGIFHKLVQEPDAYKELPPGDKFKLSFFFNKLYVAITRAKEKLLILDTEKAYESFWKPLRYSEVFHEIEEEYWENLRSEKAFVEGNPTAFEEIDHATAKRNADADWETALLYSDPKRMRDAARWYKMLGPNYQKNMVRCEAKALEFEFKYEKAASLYEEINDLEDASRCYWINGSWEELLEVNKSLQTDTKYQIRNFVASVMLGKVQSLDGLFRHKARIPNAFRDRELRFPLTWVSDFYKKLSALILQLAENIDDAKKEELATTLVYFRVEDPHILGLIARLYFNLRNFNQAVVYWDQIESVDHTDYQKARFEISSDPGDKLHYLSFFAPRKEILEFYAALGEFELDKQVADKIQRAYLQEGKFKEAIRANERHHLSWPSLLQGEVNSIDTRAILLLSELNSHLHSIPARNRNRFFELAAFEHLMALLKKEKAVRKWLERGSNGASDLIDRVRREDKLMDFLREFTIFFSFTHLPPEKFSGDYFRLFKLVGAAWAGKRELGREKDYLHLIVALERSKNLFKDIVAEFAWLLKQRSLEESTRKILENRYLKVLFKLHRRDLGEREEEISQLDKDNITRLVQIDSEEVLGKRKFTYRELFELPDLPDIDRLLQELESLPPVEPPTPPVEKPVLERKEPEDVSEPERPPLKAATVKGNTGNGVPEKPAVPEKDTTVNVQPVSPPPVAKANPTEEVLVKQDAELEKLQHEIRSLKKQLDMMQQLLDEKENVVISKEKVITSQEKLISRLEEMLKQYEE
jgi:hypothetical protein